MSSFGGYLAGMTGGLTTGTETRLPEPHPGGVYTLPDVTWTDFLPVIPILLVGLVILYKIAKTEKK